jgi:secreted trypsin-like serine protease
VPLGSPIVANYFYKKMTAATYEVTAVVAFNKAKPRQIVAVEVDVALVQVQAGKLI